MTSNKQSKDSDILNLYTKTTGLELKALQDCFSKAKKHLSKTAPSETLSVGGFTSVIQALYDDGYTLVKPIEILTMEDTPKTSVQKQQNEDASEAAKAFKDISPGSAASSSDNESFNFDIEKEEEILYKSLLDKKEKALAELNDSSEYDKEKLNEEINALKNRRKLSFSDFVNADGNLDSLKIKEGFLAADKKDPAHNHYKEVLIDLKVVSEQDLKETKIGNIYSAKTQPNSFVYIDGRCF